MLQILAQKESTKDMNEQEKIIEEKYLNKTLNILKGIVAKEDSDCKTAEEIFDSENQAYLNAMKDMDLNTLSEETALIVGNMQSALQQRVEELDRLRLERDVYEKMQDSPYFAKIDIRPDDSNEDEKYYIGRHTLNDENNNFVVLDWRSPIASVFYDYEVGRAQIVSDNATLGIDLLGKRQFKIEDSKLIYYFDTNIAIEDELLQDALGQNSSHSMKSIVQTIQAEQNKIIRSPSGVDLVVNGVAGSGKTAIALHRISYLLYKLKGKLTSDSVLVLSHNNAFSSYISQVLPELAERDVNKVVLDSLCHKAISGIADIEDKYQQMDRIINNPSQVNSWSIKTSYEFYEKLNEYVNNVVIAEFKPKTFVIMGTILTKEKLSAMYYKTFAGQSLFTRICWMSDGIVNDCFYNVKNAGVLKKLKIEIFEKLYSFVENKKPLGHYLDFLKSIGLDMKLRNGKIKNEDAYPIWYIYMCLKGYVINDKIKHLVIDEMQEYSAVQLKIIDMLYPCCKTMLGDVSQFISQGQAQKILDNYDKIFGQEINRMDLNKSYRSTMQITKFFGYLGGLGNIEYVKRSGDEVGMIKCGNMVNKIVELLKSNDKYNTIAITTKTNKQAKELYTLLHDKVEDLTLISSNKDVLDKKVSIISAFNSKGLEFDYVIMYNVSEDNYNNDFDRNLLFIQASRAMHKLDLVADSDFATIIQDYKRD